MFLKLTRSDESFVELEYMRAGERLPAVCRVVLRTLEVCELVRAALGEAHAVSARMLGLRAWFEALSQDERALLEAVLETVSDARWGVRG